MEKYKGIFRSDEGVTLRPKKKSAEFSFNLDVKDDMRYKLFCVGETSQFYWWKDEPDGRFLYRDITDGLNYENAEIDRYCLDFSAKEPFKYIKRVYKKTFWRPWASYIPVDPLPDKWKVGIRVKAENLSIEKDGFLQMRLELRFSHPGVNRRDVTIPSDMTVVLPVPEGTYDYIELTKEIEIPKETVLICSFVEGKNYKGKCYFEHPMLEAGIHNMLPAFAEPVSGMALFDWSGQNISKKERPEFIIKLNGEKIFKGEIFERIHRFSEWEKLLPKGLLKKENKVEISLISDYHEALPYTIYELAVLEQAESALDIISVSEFAPVGGEARVMIRTNKENTKVTFSTDSDSISGNEEYFFKEKGLHGILINCLKTDSMVEFTLETDGHEEKGVIKNIVYKEEDKVITGTGDMIYIPQEMEEMEEYLSWYIACGVGNFITMRPCYRWSGTRELGREAVIFFARLMNELKIKYVLMVDGREVPGLTAQPDDELLKGENYLGRQAHEVDGALCYWDERATRDIADEQSEELLYYTWKEDPAHAGTRGHEKTFNYVGEKLVLFLPKGAPMTDYSEARKRVVGELKELLGDDYSRHTGPAATFKYFADGGLKWLGAETMYQNTEMILAFLRGVAKDRGMETFGVHNAVQWSTTPHDSEERFKRFRLALYVSYMLGATDINTEEGLWRLEEGYEHHHRFSKACKGHLKEQQDFYRYVSSHTRSGEFYSPVAMIHGRDDGITFFGKGNTWYKRFKDSAPEKSWDVIKEIYPLAEVGRGIYIHKCPADRPVGFYSGTPYGNLDIIPAEAKSETFNSYKLIIYMGYNKFTPEDKEKLLDYVKNGGSVLMTRAHLTSTTNIENVHNGNLEFLNMPEFLGECTESKELKEYKFGEGTIYLFDTKCYPSDIEEAYKEAMARLISEVIEKEDIWASADNDVEFSCYNQGNGDKHLYFLAVDWYNKSMENRLAKLRLLDKTYEVEVPFGVMIKAVANAKVALWPESEEAEVLSLSSEGAKVQGRGLVTFSIAKDGNVRKITVDFGSGNVKELSF